MSETPPETGAEVPQPEEAAAESAKPRRGLVRLGLALIAIIVLALAAIGTEPYWRPQLDRLVAQGPPEVAKKAIKPAAPAPDKVEAALAARLDAIEHRLASLQSLDERVNALEHRPVPDARAGLASLEAQVQKLSTRLDQVDARLAQLIKDQTARGDSAQRILIVALADLGSAVSSSRPFTAQLASVEALGRSRPGWAASLHPLEEVAKTGVPSIAVLAQQFSDDAAPAILRAAAASPGPKASMGAAILAKLRALVVIRRTDGAQPGGTPAEQAVATAEVALGKGDLAGAVAAVKTLTGAAATAAEPWLAQARQRLDAEQTVAQLTRDVSADLAAGTKTGGG